HGEATPTRSVRGPGAGPGAPSAVRAITTGETSMARQRARRNPESSPPAAGATQGTVHRLDFHLHSYASNVPDYYAANTFAIPESYSDPFALYRELKAQGMSLVTLTDHNSIDCALELLAAGRKDVFLSAEMTTTFPEDGCNIHVTVANMT